MVPVVYDTPLLPHEPPPSPSSPVHTIISPPTADKALSQSSAVYPFISANTVRLCILVAVSQVVEREDHCNVLHNHGVSEVVTEGAEDN